MKNITKKVLFISAAALLLISVLACKTTKTTAEKVDNAFKIAYERHYDNLILDGAVTRIVKSGDTLSAISREVYNNGLFFPVIMLASKDVVIDPDKIEPGMQLVIPDLQRNLYDSNARASIKSFLKEIAAVEDLRERHGDARGLRELSDSL
jgi:hypothetical protein